MLKNAEKILKELTLDEKLAQLVAHGSPSDFVKDKGFNRELAAQKYPHGLFGLMAPIDLSPEEIGAWANEALSYFETVSSVPPVIMCESLHGILGKGTTVFPQSIGMGASFDSDLMRRVAEAIGKEARALGIRMSLAPDLDLGREPRWGRLEETYGEDSYLVGTMGEAYVCGILGEDKKYGATVKHFAAHGSPRAGVNLSSVTVTEQELWDKYLPPFKKAIDAGARAVMPAYSALNGIPCHSSKHLMEEILRDKLGFDGVVISDFGGTEMLTYFQCAAEGKEDAAPMCLPCVDVEAPNSWAYEPENMKKLLKVGKITEEQIDKAVLRVLKLKLELGLFDMEKPSLEKIRNTVRCPEHRALAKEAAEKSIILLKNNGVLPIKAGAKVVVVGPNADTAQLGDYALPKLDAKTPYEAIKERAELSGGTVTYAKGCDVYGNDRSGFEEAIQKARLADVVVCVIGGKSMKGYGVGWGSEEESILTCGEGCDMHDLTPGGPQLDLVREMIKTGRDVVVISVDGRPETLFDAGENCSAHLCAWYPGEEGSASIASLIYGDVNFSAKTPVTFPKHTGQLPLCYDHVLSDYGFYHSPGTPNAPGRDYVFGDIEPQYPFGYGIGYSEIEYGALKVEWDGNLIARVKIANKGEMKAREAVLLYIRDEIASVPQPRKRLVAVEWVELLPQEERWVEITVPGDSLAFTGLDMKKRLESGWFTVTVGTSVARLYVEGE